MHQVEKYLDPEQRLRYSGFLLQGAGFNRPIQAVDENGQATDDFAGMVAAMWGASAEHRCIAFMLAIGEQPKQEDEK